MNEVAAFALPDVAFSHVGIYQPLRAALNIARRARWPLSRNWRTQNFER
jgi:hypothetical protein